MFDIVGERERPERRERMKPVEDRIPVEWGKSLPDVGWDSLLLELDAKLAAIDPGYVIYQAKEKFGGLRYYTAHSEDFEGDTDAFDTLVREAEEWSYVTCEMCGAEGASPRKGGWIKTLCDKHANER